ncbi:SurA N-terminal domain-containing protein [Shimia thalassica]|uniref:peptidylprolyl isomerase n=1 Tax=Shimia thalassica TaxID=1715693 RepID=UPI001C0816CF|nr:peptidylprolyl isomerase [Shimia thalassica]MBU2941693.1 SurA N-terminal domain-containing protein [Shimia thalassica]MDO6503926.1 SurA N-terminal domain-containing protein [Shimia thalassica]
MSKGKTSSILVWILMAMLIVGLGGFGALNLSGTVTTLGTVGDEEITLNEYALELQREIGVIEAQAGQAISFADARAGGLDQAVLANLIAQHAMDAENRRMGLSLGDENLAQELFSIPEFQNADGSFNRDAYSYAMEQARLSEAEFEESVRDETARRWLQAGLITGVAMPETYANTLLNYVGEERDVTIARLDADMLVVPTPAADDVTLRAFYDANLVNYMHPATRNISYAWLTPDMLIDTVEIDETTLRETYETRSGEYNRAERRLVERLGFATEEDAQLALDRMNRGEASFETIVDERGLQLADVDMGDVSQNELGGAAGEAVFVAPSGSIVGPVNSDLGTALFRINGILPAQSTTFEDALPVLREELAAERARRIIDTQIGDIDDLLAAGATVEELAKETEMEFGTLGWHPNALETIAGYEAFRAVAAQVKTSDFPQVEQLEDGGIFALRLDDETDATPKPFEEVRPQVLTDWTNSETVRRLQEMADGLVTQLEGTAAFDAFGLEARSEAGILRDGFVAEVPVNFVSQIFGLEAGKVIAIQAQDHVILARLDAVRAPDLTNPNTQQMRQLVLQQASEALALDVYQAYAADLQNVYPVTVNQQALNAVHAQFQ